MHKKQQDRKRRKNPFEPQAEERYFRHNEGGTDYYTLPLIPLAGAFSLSFSALLKQGVVQNFKFFSSNTNSSTLTWDSTGNVFISTETSGFVFVGSLTQNNLLNRFVVSRDVSNLITVNINGIDVSSGGAASGVLDIERLLIRSAENAVGVLADFKVSDNGVPIRNYPINDNGNTIRDLVSGQDGSVINGNTDDWGLFKEQPTLWKGQGLAVPPWDSVDQELIKA